MSKTITQIIDRRYKKIKELSDPIFEQKQINRALYSGDFHPGKAMEEDYALNDPHVFPIMRNYLSRANPSMTKIRLDARKPEDYEKREVNQHLVNWELNEILSTRLFYRLYYSGFMNGRGYFKTGWKYEPAVKISVKDDKGKVVQEKIMKEKLNRAHAEFVRFDDILIPNQNVPVLREQPYYIELINQRVGDMVEENEYLEKHGEDPYWDPKFIKKLRKSGVEKKLLDYQMDIATDDDADLSKEDFAFNSAYVAMMCMHTKDGNVYYVPLQDPDSIINLDKTNRYWHGHYPVGDFTPFPEDDNYYSLGIVDVFGDLQIAESELLSQAMTNIRQGNFNMWVAGTPAAQTPDWMFRTRPDGVIRVIGDTNQVEQIRVQDNSRNSMHISQEIATRIERASGISSLYASGAQGTSINQTARGAQIIDQNIDTNMRMIIDLFGEQVIKVIGEDFLELNAQYITEDQTVYITGKKGVREVISISPDEASANFDVFVNAERMVKQTPASRQASLQNLIQQLANIQSQTQGSVQVDLAPAVEALIDSYPEMENVTDLVVSVDEKAKRDIATLERGQEVEVKVRDPHSELIQVTAIHFEDHMQEYSPEIVEMFEKYIEKHSRYMQAKQEAQQMAQPQMPEGAGQQDMEAAMLNETEGLPGGGYNLGNIVG